MNNLCNTLLKVLLKCFLKVKVTEGRRAAEFPKLCVFLDYLAIYENIYRHAIHQIKAEYHSYLLVSMIVYVSGEVKLKIMKEIEN